MRHGSAHIRSPDALRRFRHHFIAAEDQARLAMQEIAGDVRSVIEWLGREQKAYWHGELERRNLELKRTWREYVDARYGDRRMGKPSCVDERKAWERAKRRKAEAEEKVRVVSGWSAALEREALKLMAPVKRLEALYDMLGARGVARLDFMMDRLEEYLKPAAAAPGEVSSAQSEPAGGDADVGPERPGA